MKNLIVVGGAPSSGTTLIADLLDAVPGMFCPPELYVWCYQEAYSWDRSKILDSALTGSTLDTGSCYAPKQAFFNPKYRELLNISDADLRTLIDGSYSCAAFYSSAAALMSGQLQRHSSIACEKTPMNVNWARAFCDHATDGLFLHVTRSGYDVVNSLVKRGYPLIEAALIWMYQTKAGVRARGRDAYLEVRYEDVLRDPFGHAASIAVSCGITPDIGEIAHTFQTNSFRSTLPRPKSWSAAQYSGSVIAPEPPRFTASQLAALNAAALWEVDGDGPVLLATFAELMREAGHPLLGVDEPIDRPLVDEQRRLYARSSKNLVTQAKFFVTFEDDPLKTAATSRAAAHEEIERLRRKMKKVTGG